MSKPWKIILAVGVVVIIIGLCLGGLAGLGYNRMRNFPAANRAALEMSNPPGAGRFSRPERQGQFNPDTPGQPRQLEVQLIDDDEDGIPDRGVVDLPADRGFAPGGRFDHRPGRGFVPDARLNHFPDYRFGPFILLGALFRLAVLVAVIAGAVVLGLVLYRRWRPAPAAPVTLSPAPEAGEVTEEGEPEEETIADTPLEADEPGPPDETASPAGHAGDDLEDEPASGPESDGPKT